MNTVNNTNNEKIKYLTYEDIEERWKKIGSDYATYTHLLNSYDREPENISMDILILRYMVDIWDREIVVEKLRTLPKEYLKLFSDFTNLFDKNNSNRYKLLNRLITIYFDKVVNKKNPYKFSDNYDRLVDNEEKIQRLNNTFDIFKLLRYPDMVLNHMFNSELKFLNSKYFNVCQILLNEDIFYNFLLSAPHLFSNSPSEKKYDEKTRQLLNDFFPNVNTGR